MQELIIHIQGMTCGGCVKSVAKVLNETQGVFDAQVSLENAQAKMRFNPQETTVSAIIDAIENAGFDAEVAQ